MSQDAMIARLSAELAERTTFQDGLVAAAQADGRDLTAQEMELFTRAATRIGELAAQIAPLEESMSIASQTAAKSRELESAYAAARNGSAGGTVEYRSAGEYILDRWQAAAGVPDAMRRMESFERVAAHQTTADNLGVIPNPVVGPVLNFIDAARPLVSALGPRSAPSGMFSRPRVTQHTDTAKQTAEKTELASRKMLISSLPVSMSTYGGYVNVSRQNIDWSSPNIMDLVVQDLAGQYALDTEAATATALEGAATPQTPALPATPTPQDIANAIWKAAGTAYAAMQGAGRLILAVAPDVLGLLGSLFAPVNPTNAQGSGFSAGSFGPGVMGQIGGIPVVMSPAISAGTALLVNTAAAEVYEQRIGSLQVTEPSVLGVQVAYAGYFAALIISAGGIIKLDSVV